MVVYRRLKNIAEVVKDPLWARNWAKYGVAVSQAMLGDILVFVRNGGGHVGFYIGEDSNYYYVLGGNQSNKVCITRILKSRILKDGRGKVIGIRRPPYLIAPKAMKPYRLTSGGAVSSNEA